MTSLLRRVRNVVVTGAVATAAFATVAPPAHADCLAAEAWVYAAGQQRWVVGPQTCVVSTPWSELGGTHQEAGPPGTRVGFTVWVPSPVLVTTATASG